MIGPPYFQLDERALLAHFSAAARACAPLPFYVYEFERASGYAVPPAVLQRLGEEAPNLAGLKVSDTPYEGFARTSTRPRRLRRAGGVHRARAGGRCGRCGLGARDGASRSVVAAVDPRAGRDPCDTIERYPRHAALKRVLQRRGVPIREDVRAAAAAADRRRATGAGRVAGRIVVAGAGAVGASIAYHLALLGARDVVLADRARDRLRRDREGDGRRPPAVLDRRGGRARARERPAFSRARRAVLRAGRIPVRRDDRRGRARLLERGRAAARARRAGRGRGCCVGRGLRADDVLGRGDLPRGRRRRARRSRARARPARGRAWGGGARAHRRARARRTTCSWSLRARRRRSSRPELPVRPLCRQLVDVGPVDGLPADLPMVVEEETGFHFRRRGETLRLAMPEPEPRWGVERGGRRRDRRGQAPPPARTAIPPAAEAPIVRAWAGLYDMTPDAHPIIGWVGDGVYAACGFSGHGFMQSPGGRPSGGRGAARPRADRRPLPVPARALRRRRYIPRDAGALRVTIPKYALLHEALPKLR